MKLKSTITPRYKTIETFNVLVHERADLIEMAYKQRAPYPVSDEQLQEKVISICDYDESREMLCKLSELLEWLDWQP